jgi:hypothetical protein
MSTRSCRPQNGATIRARSPLAGCAPGCAWFHRVLRDNGRRGHLPACRSRSRSRTGDGACGPASCSRRSPADRKNKRHFGAGVRGSAPPGALSTTRWRARLARSRPPAPARRSARTGARAGAALRGSRWGWTRAAGRGMGGPIRGNASGKGGWGEGFQKKEGPVRVLLHERKNLNYAAHFLRDRRLTAYRQRRRSTSLQLRPRRARRRFHGSW